MIYRVASADEVVDVDHYGRRLLGLQVGFTWTSHDVCRCSYWGGVWNAVGAGEGEVSKQERRTRVRLRTDEPNGGREIGVEKEG